MGKVNRMLLKRRATSSAAKNNKKLKIDARTQADQPDVSGPFIPPKQCLDVVTALKKWVKLDDKQKNKVKKLPLGEENVEKISEPVLLEIDFKKIPLNKTVFVNRMGPLPSPWLFSNSDASICIFVHDLDPKKPLGDRELDLELTKQHWIKILEDADLDEDFIANRLTIVTMRELFTEYKEDDAKQRLADAHDIFLADRSLVNSKFSSLRVFLGAPFYIYKKKAPAPIDLFKRGENLKSEMVKCLSKTDLYVTGRDSCSVVQLGLLKQKPKALARNVEFVTSQLKAIFGKNIGLLKLKTSNSIAIPYYCDLESPNSLKKWAPRTRHINVLCPPVEDDFSLMENAKLSVSSTGIIKLTSLGENEDNDLEFLDAIEEYEADESEAADGEEMVSEEEEQDELSYE